MHAVSDCRPSGLEAKASWSNDTVNELDVIHSVVFCFDPIFSTLRTMDTFLVNSTFVPRAAVKSVGSLLHCL